MTRLAGLLCVGSLASLAIPQSSLKYSAKSGASVGYTVETTETVSGADGKVTESKHLKLPIRINVVSPTELKVVSGPIFTRGRSIGRARTQTVRLNATQVPSNYFICLPANGVSLGQTWKAPFFGGPPLPAGVQATYKFVKIGADKKSADVQMSITHKAGADMSGSGLFQINLQTGFLSSGKANFTLTYSRPDPKNPQKLLVNSRTKVATVIHKD